MMNETVFDATVRLALLEAFLAGAVPSAESVAATLGASAADGGAAFERLAAGRAIVLEPATRALLMAAPFAARPTPFRVELHGQVPDDAGNRLRHANCIWDALGISAMLAGAGRNGDATVRTECADCGAPLALEVVGDTVRADPPEAVAHFAVPAAKWWADIVFT